MNPCCDLDLEIANQPFCMTLWLMMMHDNTKFSNNMFVSLGLPDQENYIQRFINFV